MYSLGLEFRRDNHLPVPNSELPPAPAPRPSAPLCAHASASQARSRTRDTRDIETAPTRDTARHITHISFARAPEFRAVSAVELEELVWTWRGSPTNTTKCGGEESDRESRTRTVLSGERFV